MPLHLHEVWKFRGAGRVYRRIGIRKCCLNPDSFAFTRKAGAALRSELCWERRAVDIAERVMVRAADCEAITENTVQSVNGS